MAEVPERIKEMFVTKEINKAGIYLMTFWINGVETPVIVDDHFPCKNNNPCFSSSDTQEIWAMLLEKAWAKLYGTYARTEGGQPSFASVHL
jgi:calpain-15